MTKQQEKILEKIESLVDELCHSDKEDKAKGEINDLKRALREITDALQD